MKKKIIIAALSCITALLFSVLSYAAVTEESGHLIVSEGEGGTIYVGQEEDAPLTRGTQYWGNGRWDYNTVYVNWNNRKTWSNFLCYTGRGYSRAKRGSQEQSKNAPKNKDAYSYVTNHKDNLGEVFFNGTTNP